MKRCFLTSVIVCLIAACSYAQAISDTLLPSGIDSAAIKQAALNYIEGWYAGDFKRMEQALHPELAKRNVVTNENNSRLTQMGALTLIYYTKAGYGTYTPKEKQQKDVIILDIYRKAASAKIIATDWIDYLHLVKWEGQWKIINVYWEEKPRK